jgi:DnaJ-class molecular chaperone
MVSQNKTDLNICPTCKGHGQIQHPARDRFSKPSTTICNDCKGQGHK